MHLTIRTPPSLQLAQAAGCIWHAFFRIPGGGPATQTLSPDPLPPGVSTGFRFTRVRARPCATPRQGPACVAWVSNPRVSDYDRDPSRRSPPRGRCKCTFSLQVGLGKLSQSVDWPLSHVATVGGRLNDCENFKKDLSGGAVVLCACFPNRTPPSCLQESRFPNTKNKSFRGGHVSSGNSPFPQPEGRRPSCAIVPGWCWFPLHPRVAWSSTSG